MPDNLSLKTKILSIFKACLSLKIHVFVEQ